MYKQLLCAGLTILLFGCSTPAERASEAEAEKYEAEEELLNQRLKFVKKYEECVDASVASQESMEVCDPYLKAIKALE